MIDNKFQIFVESGVRKMRAASFAKSAQLNIGELLGLLKDIPMDHNGEPVTISFDFGTAYPDGLSSWRGAYSELAINYSLGGYDNNNASQFAHRDLKDFVEELEAAVGKEYQGWKGGDFMMSLETPLWVANDGNGGNTGVVGIRNNEYEVIILTAYCEY